MVRRVFCKSEEISDELLLGHHQNYKYIHYLCSGSLQELCHFVVDGEDNIKMGFIEIVCEAVDWI